MNKTIERLKKELSEYKPPYDESVLKKTDKGTLVDWKKIADMISNAREGTNSVRILDGTLRHLVDLKILSLEPVGNYQLSGCGVFLNPRSYGMLELYFTRKKDAEEYKQAKFGGALYSVDIFKLSE